MKYFPLLCILLVALPASGAELSRQDFAYGHVLDVDRGDGLYVLDVPLSVYTKAIRADLGDLRIFDGAGQPVPHAVRQPAMELSQSRQPVPFFPLVGERQAASGDLSLRVARNPDGTVITVDTGDGPAKVGSSYLLDITKLDPRPNELELRWTGPEMVTLSLMHSSDLTRWSPLVDRLVLADLNYNDGRVVSRRIPLSKTTLPYVRLDCTDCREPLQVEEVTGLSGTPATADQWQWLRVQGTETRGAQGERTISYRSGATVRVTAMQLALPTTPSLLRAAVDVRSHPDAPWRQIAQTDFYRLTLHGQTLSNPPILCTPTSAGDWRLRVLADSGGVVAPELELGWRPDQVVFLGRGAGSYTLAFGSSRAAQLAPSSNSLVLAALQAAKAEEHIQRIEPGALVTLGGDAALKPGLEAINWKQWILWTVLLGGVILIALMARTVLREMRANKG